MKQTLSFFLACLIALNAMPFAALAQTTAATSSSADTPPLLKAYLAVDLSSGKVLTAKNERRVYPIASITKLMTAAVALDNYNLNDEVLITREILDTGGTYGGLKFGERWRINDLLYAMLMESSNDAAEALASKMGRAKFIALMNEKARGFGMRMRFYDPSGLSLRNGGSAEDLVKLLRGIYEDNPFVFTYTTRSSYIALTSSDIHYLKNLLGYAGEPWFVGGKTGYLTEVGKNYAGIFMFGKTPVAAVSIGSPLDNFAELEKVLRTVGDALGTRLALPDYCAPGATLIYPEMDRQSCLLKPEFATGKSIEINLSKPKIRLYKDGKLIAEYWMSKVIRGAPFSSGISVVQEKLTSATVGRAQYDYVLKLYPLRYLASWPRMGNSYLSDLAGIGFMVFGSKEQRESDSEQVFDFADPDTPVVIFE